MEPPTERHGRTPGATQTTKKQNGNSSWTFAPGEHFFSIKHTINLLELRDTGGRQGQHKPRKKCTYSVSFSRFAPVEHLLMNIFFIKINQTPSYYATRQDPSQGQHEPHKNLYVTSVIPRVITRRGRSPSPHLVRDLLCLFLFDGLRASGLGRLSLHVVRLRQSPLELRALALGVIPAETATTPCGGREHHKKYTQHTCTATGRGGSGHPRENDTTGVAQDKEGGRATLFFPRKHKCPPRKHTTRKDWDDICRDWTGWLASCPCRFSPGQNTPLNLEQICLQPPKTTCPFSPGQSNQVRGWRHLACSDSATRQQAKKKICENVRGRKIFTDSNKFAERVATHHWSSLARCAERSSLISSILTLI